MIKFGYTDEDKPDICWCKMVINISVIVDQKQLTDTLLSLW
jgi:hypothetical protein